MTNLWSSVRSAQSILALVLIPASLMAEPIPLKRVVELALTHATGLAVTGADEQRAAASYRELKDSYIPQLSTGAGIGYAYGYPLSLAGSAPSLFNVNAQSAVWDASLREFIKAARAESAVASLKDKDQRNQVIQDAAQSYAELGKWEQRLNQLQQTQAEAERTEAAVQERVKEGVDTQMDRERAHLTTLRVRLHIAEAQGSADVLREHLSKLTGLPAPDIQSEPDSVPDFPALPQETPTPATTDANPSVQAAVEHAHAQYLRARAEHRALLPSFDFAAQYALLSTFNNFQSYYTPSKPCLVGGINVLCVTNSFHRNNETIGVAIRFPFLNLGQHARGRAADADALIATKQAEVARNQVSEGTLRYQRAVTQMQAARDVAQVEYDIAEKTVAAVETRMQAGISANGATANLHDLEDARSRLSDSFIALQDATFEVQRAELGLLRSTGELEKWALGK
jgi:outer membrane protein TolC